MALKLLDSKHKVLNAENIHTFIEDVIQYIEFEAETHGYEDCPTAHHASWNKMVDFILYLCQDPARISKNKTILIKLLEILDRTKFQIKTKKNLFKIILATADQDINANFLKFLQYSLIDEISYKDEDFCSGILSYCSPYIGYLINRCDQNIGKALRRFKFSEEAEYHLVSEGEKLSLLNEILPKSLEDLEGFPELMEFTAADWQNLQSRPPRTWKEVVDQLVPGLEKIEDHRSFWPNRNSALSKISELIYLLEIQGAKNGKNLSYIFYQKALMAFYIVRIVYKNHLALEETFLELKFPRLKKFPLTSEFFAVIKETSNLLFQQSDIKQSHFRFFHPIIMTMCDLLTNMSIPENYHMMEDKDYEEEKEVCDVIEAFMASKSIGKPQDSLLYGLVDLAFTLVYKRNAKRLAEASHGCAMLFHTSFEEMADPYDVLLVDITHIIYSIRTSHAFLSSTTDRDKLIPCTFVYPEEAKAVVQLLASSLANFDLGRFYVPSKAVDMIGDSMQEFMDSYDYYPLLALDKIAENMGKVFSSLLDEKVLGALETHPKRDLLILRTREVLDLLGKPLYHFPECWVKAKENNQTKLIGTNLVEKTFSIDCGQLIDNKLSKAYPKSFIQIARIPFIHGLMALKDWVARSQEDLPSQQVENFFANFEKFYKKYQPSGKYLEFTLLTNSIPDDEDSDKTILKYFDEGKLFENLPELFWDKIEPEFKVRFKDTNFFEYYRRILNRKDDTGEKIANAQDVLGKLVSYTTQNIALELKNFEQTIESVSSLSEEDLLKAVDKQHSLKNQWEFLLSTIKEAISDGFDIKDYYLQIVELLKYPSILFLDKLGNRLWEMAEAGIITYSGTDENRGKLIHLIFDNLLEIYCNLWGESSTQWLIVEGEVLQIPLFYNNDWLFHIVEEFQNDNDEANMDWRIGMKMDPKSRQFVLYLFYTTRVCQKFYKYSSYITPKMLNYPKLEKLKQVIKSSTVILKITIQKYLEAKLSQEDAFSAEKAELTYEDLVHPMIGSSLTFSLFKKMAMTLLRLAGCYNTDFPKDIVLFLFSQFETHENKDLQRHPKEASKRLWNVLLFDFLQDVSSESFITKRIASNNKALYLHQVIFEPNVFPKITNWIINFTPLECLNPLFEECDTEIKKQFNATITALKNDVNWIKTYGSVVKVKYEQNQNFFSRNIAHLAEIVDTRKNILPILRSDSMPMLIDFIELFMKRIELLLEAEEGMIFSLLFFFVVFCYLTRIRTDSQESL